ncbi:MAG TPA: YegS/Rv2252/BmrU family lipid kinase [Candidatus Limnocylindrales bacterium]|jgi:YegS/Rv2252/BmrU family lipid kinase|nr:YegS/Rv2252/BmrU family lipid kinase [Candidatus Limnocylindrales bacterium]
MTRVLVLGRVRPGREIARHVAETSKALRAGGWKVEDHVVKRKRALRKRAGEAAKDGVDVVVAVGGDGAVLQVATAIAGSKTALGIIPLGTGNLLAGNLGVPKKPAAAVKTILGRRRRRIDVGRIEVDGTERCFTVACGIGYDAEVMDATTPPQKLRWGKLAYLANAIGQTDELRAVRHVITVDGRRIETEASQVFVANQGKMLPIVAPRRRIKPDDGLLDVIVVRTSGTLPALIAGWDAMVQETLGKTDDGKVYRTQGRKIEIETEPGRLVEVDGSVIGSTPVSITVEPKALSVLVPK